MKHSNDKKEDPLPIESKDRSKDALDDFKLFYEALPFEPSYSERITPRLRRPSRSRA